MITQRKLSFEILKKTYIDKKYANLLLRNELNKLPYEKRAFVNEIVYGVIRNDLFLRFQFQSYLKEKTKEKVNIILMMAYYEYVFLNEKKYVITNEYVGLVDKTFKPLVNAILRNKLENVKSICDDSLENISIKYSIPLWIIKLLNSQHPLEFKNILDDYQNNRPKVFYRINPLKFKQEMIEELGIEFIDEKYFVSKNNLTNSKYFEEGYFYVQDYGSKDIVEKLEVKDDDLILDMCAAPGSKSFNILEKIKNKNNLFINDISLLRLNLIKDKAYKLGYKNLNFLNFDALKIFGYDNYFDKILLDAPCSGFGVFKRKVDLKNKIQPTDLDEIVKLQEKLLDKSYTLLKKGGILVYSTCTLNVKENHKQVLNFLKKYKDLKLIEEENVFPKEGHDGFFIAKIFKMG